jgi:hypothetical protein
MVMCGANVNCKGGCSVAYTAPECETALMPPSCMADANCEASCQSQAQMSATCTPPTVNYQCTSTVSSDLQSLLSVLETDLPALISASVEQGKIAASAAGTLVSTGQAEVSAVGSLTGQALACATAAVQGAVSAQTNIQASVSVSVTVTASASASGG